MQTQQIVNKHITTQDREKLIKACIRYVDNFPKPGIAFLDIMPLFDNPQVYRHTIQAFADVLSGVQFDKILCLEARGFLFGSTLGFLMNKPFGCFRKKGKLPGELHQYSYDLEYGKDTIEIQKDALKADQRVVLLDDFLATGGTMNAAINLVEKCGATVAHVLFLGYVEVCGGLERLKCEKSKVTMIIKKFDPPAN